MLQDSTNVYQVNNQQGTLPTYQPNSNIKLVQPSFSIQQSSPTSEISTPSKVDSNEFVELSSEEEDRFYKSVRKA